MEQTFLGEVETYREIRAASAAVSHTMAGNRDWMYKRFVPGGGLNQDFLSGLERFIQFATSQPRFISGDNIKCPCTKCKNRRFQDVYVVRTHIGRHGFVKDYKIWCSHGESLPCASDSCSVDRDYEQNTYERMIIDAVGHEYNVNDTEEPPNPQAQHLYDMLKAADAELWPGCHAHTQFSLVARLMNLKSENNMSEKCFDQITQLMKEIVPENNLVTENFYSTKKLLRGLGLPVEKIDSCYNNCMIFWGADDKLLECKFCGHRRFKNTGKGQRKPRSYKRMYYFPVTPRLQRLYASNVTAKDMGWHASSVEDGVMRHPADSPAWKHFNQVFPDFALEPRNVRLGLSTDGFQPFGQSGQQYSSWPVIITPYNLPPWLCMKEQYMFLTVLVPGPKNPKEKLDVFLQPLISELRDLWEVGVCTYDVSLRQNFQMRAALLWTISDFPAYSMLSGWSTSGRLACPYCMTESDAFTLQCSGKQSWFDNHRKFLPLDHPFRRNKRAFIKNKVITSSPPQHRNGVDILNEIEMLGLRKVTEIDSYEINSAISQAGFGWKKRSIFWDLPYWSSLLIRHNLDVMHIEKNVFDNIFNTIMNIPGKTKDTTKSREELNLYCCRPELKRDEMSGKYPKASYTLDKVEKKILCDWIKALKFPDGYASNLSRCVDMQKLKMFGMKSHDCHVLMQRILPIAFCELLPQNIWKAITELSLFFRDLTSANIKIDDMCRLHENIPLILCKLERIFPPSLFDSMEHLPVHLADEARIAGPVQYRWMYPFERYLRKLKNNVRNKARVEGSICNAYLVEEASSFCSYYFEDHVSTRHRNVPRNYDGRGEPRDENPNCLSIFKYPGKSFGKVRRRFLTDEEYNAASIYVLLNCIEVEPYVELFVDEMQVRYPNRTNDVDGDLSAPSDDHRLAIRVEGNALLPSHQISNKLKLIFEGLVHPEGMAWKFIPQDHKNLYFEEFKKQCKWDASDDKAVYSLWRKKVARRYSEFVYDIKKDGRRPPFITANVWPSWQRYWNSEKFRKMSAQGRANRMSEPDGPGTGIITHKGGTRSAVEYALDFAKKDGVSVNEVAWNVFNVFHPPDVGASNSKAARIVADVRRKAIEQNQSGISNPDMNSIFLDLAREESKKNRMFGLGCMATSSNGQSTEVCSQTHDSIAQMRDKLKEELRGELRQEMRGELRDEMRGELKEELREELRGELKGFEQMRAEFEAFRSQFMANYRPPPS